MADKISHWFRAYTNIALIKYWGKKNETLIIPQNDSLSLTLDAFYTDTQVTFSPDYVADELYIDEQKQTPTALKKAQVILNNVRQQAQIKDYAKVTSFNHVPTAAGLASSASGLAALAGAAADAAELNLSDRELSRLARKGSGSASRSIFGDFVQWHAGHSDETSYAEPFADSTALQMAMIFIIVDDEQKDVSSTIGMQRAVETSPYYPAWKKTAATDLKQIKEAIIAGNFKQMGIIAESSALKMHALNISSMPPFNYWSPQSIVAMNKVQHLREQGFDVYFTMDAGPNVKMICRQEDVPALMTELKQTFASDQLVVAFPGPGLQKLDESERSTDDNC